MSILDYVLIPKWKLTHANNNPLTNNLAESANSKIKSITGIYKLKPVEMVNKIIILIDNQFLDVTKAFYNEGLNRMPNNVAPTYKLTHSQLNTPYFHFLSNYNNTYEISTNVYNETYKTPWKKYQMYKHNRPFIQ